MNKKVVLLFFVVMLFSCEGMQWSETDSFNIIMGYFYSPINLN